MCITVPAASRPAGTSHSSLMPIANTCGCRPTVMRERRMSCFVRLPRTPSARIVTLARMSTPGSNVALRLAVAVDATIARPHSYHPLAVHQQLGPGESRKQVDAFGLDESGEPLAKLLQRDDVIAVIAKGRRRDGKRDLAGLGQEVDAVFVDFRRERRAFRLEVGNQFGERPRVENRARQQMRARFSGLLEHGDAERRASAFCSCASLSAADNPAGPPPTIRMSTSRVSRSLILRISTQRRKAQRIAFSSNHSISCVFVSLR